MKVKLILPALAETNSPFRRPVKYSLFPPLGLATLAGYLSADDEVTLEDQHVENIKLDDEPDLVILQVYITNAYRAYEIADHYRNRGSYVVLGGLHVAALPEEASQHADSIFLGPGEDTIPEFLKDLKAGKPQKQYVSSHRILGNIPPVRRDLIKRERYLAPNSLVATRGCHHSSSFSYEDTFCIQKKSFYTQRVDAALMEIERLPGQHLYFLDDHLLSNTKFAYALFEALKGMNRVFQCSTTIDSILREDLITKAAKAGLHSVLVGFDTFPAENRKQGKKKLNLQKDYDTAIKTLHDNGIMINGSFVFGLDDDDKDVFKRTVDWAVEKAITTSTYHILTPYPGTPLFEKLHASGRISTYNWELYDTRHVVYRTKNISAGQLQFGYAWAYKEFYRWSNIFKASLQHDSLRHCLKHLIYAAGWKKFEPVWSLLTKTRNLNNTLPVLEASLLKTDQPQQDTTYPAFLPQPATCI